MSIAARTKVKPPPSLSVTYSVISTGVFQAEIGWTAPTSAWPNSYYVVYRDGAPLDSGTVATNFRDTNVFEGDSFNYAVSTVNVNEVEGGTTSDAGLKIPSYPMWQTGWSLAIEQNTTASIASRASDPDDGSLTFSKQGGTAPSGVTVNSAGTVAVGSTSAGSYSLGIRASNASLSSDITISLSVNAAATAPNPVDSFAATPTSSSSIQADWTAPSSGPTPTAYDIDYKRVVDSTWTDFSISLVTSVSITGLDASTGYDLRIRTENNGLFSSFTTASATTFASSQSATWIIPATTSAITFDGSSSTHSGVSGPSRAVQAGDIIELAAGTHGRRHFDNVIGTASNRITIRNGSAGQVIIRHNSVLTSGFTNTFNNCRHVNFVGNNSSAAPEHPLYPGETIGFKFMYSSAATISNKDSPTSFVKFQAANATTVTTDHIKMSHFEIDGGWNQTASQALSDGGIGIQTQDQNVLRSNNPGKFQDDLEFAYFVIRNCNGEGMYLGPNFANGTIPMKNVHVHHFYTDMTGGDGVNGKCWFEGTNSVHNFVIERACRDSTPAGTPGCLSIISGKADVYDGIVEDGGIASGPAGNGTGVKYFVQNGPNANTSFDGYGPYSSFPVSVWNVVAARNNNHGVSAAGQSGRVPYLAKFYNITSVDNLGNGLNTGSTTASGGFIRNSIAYGNSGNVSAGGGTTTSNNATGTNSSSILVNPGGGNYRLSAENLASGTIGTDIAAADIEGTARSAGTADRGAYEFL